MEVLTVRCGVQEFAMDVHAVREIRGWRNATSLPHAPEFIKGMVNLRGSVLVVVDLARRLGLPACVLGPSSVVVVVEAGDKAAGLLVDAVCDIISVAANTHAAVPETGTSAPKEFLEGLVMVEERVISVISIPALLPTEAVQGVDLLRKS